MFSNEFLQGDLFSFVVLPLMIFFSRICDVTIGTLRIIFVAKGNRMFAPILGFFEVLIWIFAISRIMQNLDNVFCYIGYAGGFATGNFIGMLIEEKLAMGVVMIQINSRKPSLELMENLNKSGFGVTRIDAFGSREEVDVIYTIVKRSDVDKVIMIIKRYNSSAFYSIQDVKSVNKGIFPESNNINRFRLNLFKRWRRGM